MPTLVSGFRSSPCFCCNKILYRNLYIFSIRWSTLPIHGLYSFKHFPLLLKDDGTQPGQAQKYTIEHQKLFPGKKGYYPATGTGDIGGQKKDGRRIARK